MTDPDPFATLEVNRNPAKNRFEVKVDGATSILEYRDSPKGLMLVHTMVPDRLRGRGIASKLATAALEYAHAHGVKVVPRCSFVADFLVRHPEYAELVADLPPADT
jgi:predicted GNAT family acetyltransferase